MHDFTALVAICFDIYVILTIIFLLLDNRDTSTTLSWIFIFILFPVLGQILYFLIGRNWRNVGKKKQLIRQHVTEKLIAILKPLLDIQQENIKQLKASDGSVRKHKLLQLLYANSNSILTNNNQLTVIQQGEDKFRLLLQDISQAKSFIHMEYFIWRSDQLTEKFKILLSEKVKAGVRVRILYDALGSFFTKKRYLKELRKAGVEIYPYYDFRSLFTIHTLNYRNHRKIVIIDGQIGYTGGMNMGQEYIDGGKQFEYWRDTHLRIQGNAVAVLQAVFLTSWLNTTGEDLFHEDYFVLNNSIDENMPIQITTSGPDSQWESIQQLYLCLIASAEKSIYIQSPYFVPDSAIHSMLKTAALSGLDVKIMMTGIPDRHLPFWSAYTFFKDLLKAGVKIYQYKKGFLHAKTISIDGELCSIGTANMDIRSFHLNYELSTLIYDYKITQDLVKTFEKDLANCAEITIEDYNNFSELFKLRNSLARLFAPLL
jgi:cardiolipin synthase